MGKQKDPSFHSGQVPSTSSGKKKDSSHDKSVSVQVLQKLDTLENLLKKKDDMPLTFKEVCTYLGYAPSYLYKLTYKNVVPHYKPTGKMIFFSKNELDEWIFKSRTKEIEDSSEKKSKDASAALGINDPNQVDMFDKPKDVKEDASTGSAQEKERLIEFPLKSRRKKNVLRD